MLSDLPVKENADSKHTEERAGVPRSVAMKLIGHQTESMYGVSGERTNRRRVHAPPGPA